MFKPVKAIVLQLVTVDSRSVELLSSIAGMIVAVLMFFGTLTLDRFYNTPQNVQAMIIFILASVQFSSLVVFCNYYCKMRTVMSLIAGAFWILLGLHAITSLDNIVVILLGIFNLLAFVSHLLTQPKFCEVRLDNNKNKVE